MYVESKMLPSMAPPMVLVDTFVMVVVDTPLMVLVNTHFL